MKRKCENSIVDLETGAEIACQGKAVMIKRPGTVWEISLCDDCANNDGAALHARAQKVRDMLLRAHEPATGADNAVGESYTDKQDESR